MAMTDVYCGVKERPPGGGSKRRGRQGAGACTDGGCGGRLSQAQREQVVQAKRLERAERKRAQAAEEPEDEEASSMWQLKYSFQDPVGVIRITEDWSGDGNGIAGLQWLGGVVLSRYMDSRQIFAEDHFVGLRVIEVGAGCGLTSIYAAMRGADVTITDMDIDKCLENVETNLGPAGIADKVCVRRLVWASAEDLAMCEPPYDMVIAGDCLYEEACITPLLKTMWELAGPETDVLLCGVVGHGILKSFLAQVDSYFTRETIDTSKIDTLAAGLSQAPSGRDSVEDSAETPTAEEQTPSGNGENASGRARDSKCPGQRALLRLRKKLEVKECVTASVDVGVLPTR
ncbi:unnamed protein product [Sphacelaria rigidula]